MSDMLRICDALDRHVAEKKKAEAATKVRKPLTIPLWLCFGFLIFFTLIFMVMGIGYDNANHNLKEIRAKNTKLAAEVDAADKELRGLQLDVVNFAQMYRAELAPTRYDTDLAVRIAVTRDQLKDLLRQVGPKLSDARNNSTTW